MLGLYVMCVCGRLNRQYFHLSPRHLNCSFTRCLLFFALETDAGDESDESFSDCVSNSGSESEDNESLLQTAQATEPSSVKVEKITTPAAKIAGGSPINSKSRSSRSSSSTSPEVKVEPVTAKAGAKSVATKKTGAVASTTTPKKRRIGTITESEDEESSEFEDDRDERLSVRGVRSQQTLQQHQLKASSPHSTPSSTETRRAARSQSHNNNASITPAPLTRHLSKSSTKKTPVVATSVDNSARKGSRTRNSVPDCSLRHLPYSASKTSAESASKKRRL